MTIIGPLLILLNLLYIWCKTAYENVFESLKFYSERTSLSKIIPNVSGGGQEKNLGRYAVFFQNAQKNHHPPYIFQFHGFFPWFFWHPPLLCPKKITQKPQKITTHHIFSNFMDFFHDFFDTLPFLKKKKILWWSAFEITVVNLFVMSFGK